MSISMTEVHILIEESALDAMELREQRLMRELQRVREELAEIGNAIREKKFHISSLRDQWLKKGAV